MMEEQNQSTLLSAKIRLLLADAACEKYMTFADGQTFFMPSLSSISLDRDGLDNRSVSMEKGDSANKNSSLEKSDSANKNSSLEKSEQADEDGCVFVIAIKEEYTDLGRCLVDALWFNHPACITLRRGDERIDVRVSVYRCHIAGSVFRKKLMEVRVRDAADDIASVWEIHVCGGADAVDISGAKYASRSPIEERHLDVI